MANEHGVSCTYGIIGRGKLLRMIGSFVHLFGVSDRLVIWCCLSAVRTALTIHLFYNYYHGFTTGMHYETTIKWWGGGKDRDGVKGQLAQAY